MRPWIRKDGAPISLAVLSSPNHPAGLRARVARLRRAFRDVCDRAARRHASWRGVEVAGMARGEGTALVLVRHPGTARAEVADVFGGRWPDAVIGDAVASGPSWAMATEDAADLARARRGVEALRIVVPARRAAYVEAHRRTATGSLTPFFEPMPITFWPCRGGTPPGP